MGAAFLAAGETLVDPVAIGLVGDDEDAAVGGSGRGGEQDCAGDGCGGNSHETAPGAGIDRLPDRPKRLRMINQGTVRRGFGCLICPESGTSKALTPQPRYRNGGTMNGLLAICSICREI